MYGNKYQRGKTIPVQGFVLHSKRQRHDLTNVNGSLDTIGLFPRRIDGLEESMLARDKLPYLGVVPELVEIH